MNLTQSELRRILRYEPVSGVCTWLVKRPGVVLGKRAGSRHWTGYRYITVYGKAYPEHHVIWFYVTGKWPLAFLDHKNRVRDDNRWQNLRDASKKQNNENCGLRKDSKSGIRGVCWHAGEKAWRAYIHHNGKQHHLGLHPTKAKAKYARLAAERALFTHSEAACQPL